jgi:hypothetical protein
MRSEKVKLFTEVVSLHTSFITLLLRLISLTTRFIPLKKRASEDRDLMMEPGTNHFPAQRIALRVENITRGIRKQGVTLKEIDEALHPETQAGTAQGLG